MILNCRVVAVELGSQFTDEQERITVFIEEADPMHNRIRLKNTARLKIGDEFTCRTPEPEPELPKWNRPEPAAGDGYVDSKPAGYLPKGSGA